VSRLALFAAVVLAAACASSSGPPPQTSDRIIAITDVGVLRATDQNNPGFVRVKVAPDSVLTLLRTIYQEQGIDVKLFDPAKGEIGNRNFSKYYNLKGVALHNFVGCGTSATGPSADTYRITMSVVSSVQRDSTGSDVTTHLEAKADNSGSSTGMLSCLSTGMLEARINQLLLSRSGG
jgi:hypothetical protein